MLEVSGIARRRVRIYNFVSFNPISSGSLLTPFLTFLTLQIFVLFFYVLDLVRCFLYILLVCLDCAFNQFA
jgi:hypothetical protein